MIKRTTVLIFILLANLVLLAHAVVPHHHHQSVTCISKTHCAHTVPLSEHDGSSNHAQHDEPSQQNNCLLKLAVIIPSLQGKLVNNVNYGFESNFHDSFVISYTESVNFQPVSHSIIKIPNFSIAVAAFVIASPGLRAPPLV